MMVIIHEDGVYVIHHFDYRINSFDTKTFSDTKTSVKKHKTNQLFNYEVQLFKEENGDVDRNRVFFRFVSTTCWA